jgi:hypothetical protein
VGTGDLEQLDEAGVGVDLDFDHLRAPGIGRRDVALEALVLVHAGRLVVERGHHQFGLVLEVQVAQQLGQFDDGFAAGRVDDEAAAQVELGLGDAYFFAATARILALAFFAAPIAELPAMKVVRLACTPTSQGVIAVSLLTTVMAEIGRPSSSQTSCEARSPSPGRFPRRR